MTNFNYDFKNGFSGSNFVQVYHHYSCGTSVEEFSPENNSHQPGSFSFSPVIGAFHPYAQYSVPTTPSLPEFKSSKNIKNSKIFDLAINLKFSKPKYFGFDSQDSRCWRRHPSTLEDQEEKKNRFRTIKKTTDTTKDGKGIIRRLKNLETLGNFEKIRWEQKLRKLLHPKAFFLFYIEFQNIRALPFLTPPDKDVDSFFFSFVLQCISGCRSP